MMALTVEVIGRIILHVVFTVIRNLVVIEIVTKNILVRIDIKHKERFVIIRLIIDIIAMDFIVSMGLGVIVQTHTRLRKAGGFLRLAGAQPLIMQLIKTTGLDRLLDIYESVDQALK